MDLIVEHTDYAAKDILRLRLRPANGESITPFTPGSHLKFRLPSGITREYSLTGNGRADSAYEVAVLLREGGSGSTWMHGLKTGDAVWAELGNDFALQPSETGYLLIAGGIGITPILSMSRHLTAMGGTYALHYAGKHADGMAYRDEVLALGGLCHESGSGNGLRGKLAKILAGASERDVYVCGPASLIEAVVNYAKQADWPDGRVHYELFEGSLAKDSDAPFEVELRQSGMVLPVARGQNLMAAMMAAGVEPLHDCKRGECGMCLTPVLEGVPDHRDHYLSAIEKARNDAMCVCVSRSLTPKLALDI